MLYLGLKLATIEKFVINYFLFQNIIGLFNQMGKMFLFKKTCIYAKMSIALSTILINKIKLMKFISLKKICKRNSANTRSACLSKTSLVDFIL
jgi:hypothetical protein